MYLTEKRSDMTTTISMPQKLCEQVAQTAQSIGVSQRRFLIAAIQEYLNAYKANAIRNSVNNVYKNYAPDEFELRLQAAGIESIRELTKNDTW